MFIIVGKGKSLLDHIHINGSKPYGPKLLLLLWLWWYTTTTNSATKHLANDSEI